MRTGLCVTGAGRLDVVRVLLKSKYQSMFKIIYIYI